MSPAKLARLLYRHTGAYGIRTEHGMYKTAEYLAWRDTPRNWKWIQTDHGTYVQVEDK
jgi:hypothetical protein